MTRRIIIPAAGDAVRFGGLPKELLPISETDCSLTRSVKLAHSLGGCAVVITNPIKEAFHRAAIARAGAQDVDFKVRNDWKHKDLWGSIERGLERGAPGGLILADTVPLLDYKVPNLLMQHEKYELVFGEFWTDFPERFSVVLADRIATKEKNPGRNLAWGMVFWSAAVTTYLLEQRFDHYDRAFEAVMKNVRVGRFILDGYYDLGTFSAYKEFLKLQEPPIMQR